MEQGQPSHNSETEAQQPRPSLLARPARPLNAYLSTTAAVILAALLAKILESFLALPNLSIIFLAAVLFSSFYWGLLPSIYASVLSVLIYDFFFVEPLYTLTIARPEDILDLVIFLIVAILTSNLTARVREQARAARQREVRTATLYALSREIAGAAGLDDVLRAIVNPVARMLGARVVVLLPEHDQLILKASQPENIELTDAERARAMWAWQHGEATGRGTAILPEANWFYLPLRTTRGSIGVLGLQFENTATLMSPEQRELLDALAGQAAVAIERTHLVEEMEKAQVLTETEHLRTALLSSLSHDLRTPLASIMGAVTSLLDGRAIYDESARHDLLLTIREEASRLNRFVGNLLDMTRLESGALELNRDWIDIRDVIGSALARMREQLREHHLLVQVQPNLPLVWLDFVLVEQVIVNLLDNAAKYSPTGSGIHIDARRQDESILLQVTDEGIGVPTQDLERIFDKFFRVQNGDRQSAGTGLGLSICRGIVEAHGGHIAASRPANGRGTTFTVTFPLEKDQPIVTERDVTNV